VLGDLCGDPSVEDFSTPFRDLLGRVSGDRLLGPAAAAGLPDSITVLQTNYRFGAESGIGAVSRALREKPERAFELLASGEHPDVTWVAAPSAGGLADTLRQPILEGYGPLLQNSDPHRAHAAFTRFQLLCAVRRGPFGVEAVNRAAEALLAEAGWIEPRDRWYPGRPVLVTRNEYASGLFNGDVGIALPDPEAGGELRVHFPAPDGSMRSVAPGRVPDHQTAYAMTVHKSQGSEFERVLLILPERDSLVLTRELLYTGITRARTGVAVWGHPEVFAAAAARRTVRPSGLRERLWGAPGV
jgi:exodeoxyribonuclease V alpha subunit